jgi:hypothetical protein
MTRDDIIRMARETGYYDYLWKTVESGALECFATLVAAAEREACAKIADAQGTSSGDRISESIRARSTA